MLGEQHHGASSRFTMRRFTRYASSTPHDGLG
jgi:hypothetical protein